MTTMIEGTLVIDATVRAGLVEKNGDLSVDVKRFPYDLAGTKGKYLGTVNEPVTDAQTNYVFLDSAEALVVNTTGFPAGQKHIPLAKVTAQGGVITAISDERPFLTSSDPNYDGGVNYQGTWNASTNTPTLSDSGVGGVKGDYYVVSVAGSTSVDGITDWKVKDWIINNGTVWEKVDNTESVVSVAGKTGAVTLVKGDVSLGNVDNIQQIPLSEKGVANGVAELDSGGKVPGSQLPPGSGDENVKADGTDTVAGHLIDKLSAGPGTIVEVVVPVIISPLARYHLDEAASGQGPTDAIDKMSTPFNLPHFYSTTPLQPEYFSDGFGRGLEWITAASAGGPHASTTSTKIETNIGGATKASFCVVIDIDNVSGVGVRFFTIGKTSSNGAFGLLASESDKISFTYNDKIVKFNMAVESGKKVVHAVFDSDQSDPVERLRVYSNGIRLAKDSGVDPSLSETLDLSDVNMRMFIGNRDGDIRSPDGRIKYCAIFDGALSEDQITMEKSALLTNDDADPTPSLTGKTVRVTAIRGKDFQKVESLGLNTTTASTPQDKPGAVLTTPPLTGFYEVRATYRHWNDNLKGHTQLWNDTDSVAVSDDDTYTDSRPDQRAHIEIRGYIRFTGSAKTFKIRFWSDVGGNLQEMDQAIITIEQVEE